MPGLGKTQLAIQYAETSFAQHRYSVVFWISAATVEKLNQGFSHIVDRIGIPVNPDNPDQSKRLSVARQWLEEAPSSVKWILIFDNANKESVEFLRDHLPRRNPQGRILFTTRTKDVAQVLTATPWTQPAFFELPALDVEVAAELFLKEAGIPTESSTSIVNVSNAKALVKCLGHLPLAISKAASYARKRHKNLEDILMLYESEQKYEVSALHSGLAQDLWAWHRSLDGKTIYQATSKSLS
jgi:hypothetical protein